MSSLEVGGQAQKKTQAHESERLKKHCTKKYQNYREAPQIWPITLTTFSRWLDAAGLFPSTATQHNIPALATVEICGFRKYPQGLCNGIRQY